MRVIKHVRVPASFAHQGGQQLLRMGYVRLLSLTLLLISSINVNSQDAPGPAAAPEAKTDIHKEFLEIARQLKSGSNEYHGTRPMHRMEARLLAGNLSPAQRISLLYQLSEQELFQGKTSQAVKHIDTALALIEDVLASSPAQVGPNRAFSYILRTRALAYMRLGEERNCVEHRGINYSDRCIFPLRGGGIHRLQDYSNTALESLIRFLQRHPTDYDARWSANIVAMTLGRHPEAVPEPFRIGSELSNAADTVPRFVDVAHLAGVDPIDLAGGVMVEDFDADGYLDIVSSTSDPFGSLKYFHNLGNGLFEERTIRSGLNQQLGGLNAISADYDGDGDMDILVLRGAWLFEHGHIRNSLLNNAAGVFTDVTRAVGLTVKPMPTQAAVWGDFDNDGDLDLYVVNETYRDAEPDFSSQFFRNDGQGEFTEEALDAGVTNDRYGKGVTAGDYDNDGDLDIYVSNIGPNRLYRNRGDGTFEDVAPKLGLTAPAGRSFAPWFFDYNNDGWLDLFVGAYDTQVKDVARDYLGLPHEATSPALYRNNGDGTFTDVAAQLGLNHAYLPMGANFGDLDNDGYLDIYLGTGDPDFATLIPNVMLRNVRGQHFEDVTVSGGFGHLQKGHGIAFNDIDNDGDQDIYHQLGGFFPADKFTNALFLNPGTSNHYLKVELRGMRSNRGGIGVRLQVDVETPAGPRQIHRAVGSVSSFGGSSLARQEIGLGNALRISRLSVWWPTTGTRTVFEDVPMDALIRITEGVDEFEQLRYSTMPSKKQAAEKPLAASQGALPSKYDSARAKASGPISMPIRRPGMSSAGG